MARPLPFFQLGRGTVFIVYFRDIMSSFEPNTTRSRQPHLTIREAATETQAIISRGEDVLDRVQRVAHGIEEHVRQLLEDAAPIPPLKQLAYRRKTEPRP
jgi:hypothetical protein